MTRSFSARLLLLAFCFTLRLPLRGAETSRLDSPPAAPVPASATNLAIPFEIQPGPDDGRIAFVTAQLLQRFQFSHHPFNDTYSSEFLDEYLNTLDPQHVHFLQSDVDEFQPYRTNLDSLTLSRRDAMPAFRIFDRFVDRLKQRVAYADELLAHDKFEFNTDARITIDRHDSAYPENLDAAKKLWRERLRYEYLQEKLNLEDAQAKKKISAKSDADKGDAAQKMHDEIVKTLTHRYQRTLRLFTDWDNEDVMGIYLTALAHVYDPHSDYFNQTALESFRISMNLQLFGIGAELRSDDGYCKIMRILTGGPASKSKQISVGDRIVAVAQGDEAPVDVVDMSLTKIVQMIRGPKGTVVRLTILPAGESSSVRKVVTLVRDEIPLVDQAAKGQIIDLPNAKGGTTRLGVINLPSFYAPMDLGASQADEAGKEFRARSTSADVARLLTKFEREHVQGVILDLRNNGGGSLEEAIKLTGLFIKQGPVVQVASSDGSIAVDEDTDPSVLYDGPLLVLTSRFSASASEIVAGALQDYGRAIIVGDKSTHGKGTVQTLLDLKAVMRLRDSDTNDPGALKVTIRKFYRPSGASTQLKGVLPDIVLPSVLNYAKDIGESSLDHPLPWDTIPSAKYDKLNLVQPYLPELLRRSSERVATNLDFVFVRQDIQEYRKHENDKTVSLNEKQRLKEMEQADARQKAREKELLARKEPDETIYDISLKQASLPGLPPPEEKTNSVALAGAASDAAAVATNSVAATSPGTARPAEVAPASDTEEESPPTVDVDLEEAENIMLDYLSLLPKGSPLLATQNGQSQ